MKHLKSRSSDLRRLFERTICIREIAEPLLSFDIDQHSKAVQAVMDRRNFDVVGIRENGQLVGYVRREDLNSGPIRERHPSFRNDEIIADSEPLLAAMQALRHRNHIFISIFGHVGGIVTKGDLQKSPVRLWLFGIISLIEMQMLRIIRDRFPDGTWQASLSANRLEAATKLFGERQRRNEEANASEFSDCLQLCDKATIFLKDPQLSVNAGFSSRNQAERFFSDLEALRNDLAHSNDILNGRWPKLAELATQAEELLKRLESWGVEPLNAGAPAGT